MGVDQGRVLADVRGEQFRDHATVGGGVSCQPLQRVDAAHPHDDLLAAELVDSLREPLGELAFLRDRELSLRRLELGVGRIQALPQAFPAELHLPPGCVRAKQQHQAAHNLHQDAADVVLRPEGIPGAGERAAWCQMGRQDEHGHRPHGNH